MTLHLRSTVAIAGSLTVAAVALVGCSSEASDTAAATTAECTTEALQPVVNDQADALGRGNIMPIDDLRCADGWAVATGTIQPKGEPGIFIFEGQGAEWIWQSPAEACGKTADTSTIPAALFAVGCEAS